MDDNNNNDQQQQPSSTINVATTTTPPAHDHHTDDHADADEPPATAAAAEDTLLLDDDDQQQQQQPQQQQQSPLLLIHNNNSNDNNNDNNIEPQPSPRPPLQQQQLQDMPPPPHMSSINRPPHSHPIMQMHPYHHQLHHHHMYPRTPPIPHHPLHHHHATMAAAYPRPPHYHHPQFAHMQFPPPPPTQHQLQIPLPQQQQRYQHYYGPPPPAPPYANTNNRLPLVGDHNPDSMPLPPPPPPQHHLLHHGFPSSNVSSSATHTGRGDESSGRGRDGSSGRGRDGSSGRGRDGSSGRGRDGSLGLGIDGSSGRASVAEFDETRPQVPPAAEPNHDDDRMDSEEEGDTEKEYEEEEVVDDGEEEEEEEDAPPPQTRQKTTGTAPVRASFATAPKKRYNNRMSAVSEKSRASASLLPADAFTTKATRDRPSTARAKSKRAANSSRSANAAAAAAAKKRDEASVVYQAIYSGIMVYEMVVATIPMMRRHTDNYLNATQIIKVAGVEKVQRTRILEREIVTCPHEKIQGGYGKYQGTWVPFDVGVELARKYGVYDKILPLLEYQPGDGGAEPASPSTGTNHHHKNNGTAKSAPTSSQPVKKRSSSQFHETANGGGGGTPLSDDVQTRGSKRRHSGGGRLHPKQKKKALAKSSGGAGGASVAGSGGGGGGGQQRIRTRSTSPHSDDGFNEASDVEEELEDEEKIAVNGSEPPPLHQRKKAKLSSSSNTAGGQQPTAAAAVTVLPDPDLMDESEDFPIGGPGAANALSGTNVERHRRFLKAIFSDDSNPSSVPLALADASLSPELDIDLTIDDQGHTSLHWAAALARCNVARALVKRGANVCAGNNRGETPLIRAVLVTNSFDAFGSFAELVALLGGSIECEDAKGRTVLHHLALTAGIKGRETAAKHYTEVLFDHLARRCFDNGTSETGQQQQRWKLGTEGRMASFIDTRDNNGDTAICIAARLKCRSLVEILVEVGANPAIENAAGLRAFDFPGYNHLWEKCKFSALTDTVSYRDLAIKGSVVQRPTMLQAGGDIDPKLGHYKPTSTEEIRFGGKTDGVKQEVAKLISDLNTAHALDVRAKQRELSDAEHQIRSLTAELAECRRQNDLLRVRLAHIPELNAKIKALEAVIDSEISSRVAVSLSLSPAEPAAAAADVARDIDETMIDGVGEEDMKALVRRLWKECEERRASEGRLMKEAANLRVSVALAEEAAKALRADCAVAAPPPVPETTVSCETQTVPIDADANHASSSMVSIPELGGAEQPCAESNGGGGGGGRRETLYRRLIAVCCDVPVDEVDNLVPSLLEAVEHDRGSKLDVGTIADILIKREVRPPVVVVVAPQSEIGVPGAAPAAEESLMDSISGVVQQQQQQHGAAGMITDSGISIEGVFGDDVPPSAA